MGGEGLSLKIFAEVMDDDPLFSKHIQLSASGARMLAEQARMPQRISEDFFYKRIKWLVYHQASLGQTSCEYRVPAFELGLPIFNPDSVSKALEIRLKKEGWGVRRDALRLQIDWGGAPRSILKSAIRR